MGTYKVISIKKYNLDVFEDVSRLLEELKDATFYQSFRETNRDGVNQVLRIYLIEDGSGYSLSDYPLPNHDYHPRLEITYGFGLLPCEKKVYANNKHRPLLDGLYQALVQEISQAAVPKHRRSLSVPATPTGMGTKKTLKPTRSLSRFLPPQKLGKLKSGDNPLKIAVSRSSSTSSSISSSNDSGSEAGVC